jgi:phospholipase C
MESNLQKIDHIVVLMLENRSFDNMLGFLGASKDGGQRVNGVAGKQLSNPIPDYAPRPAGHRDVLIGVETVMTHPNPDPGEEYAHVNTQLFGEIIPEENRTKPFDKKPAEPYNLPKRESYIDAPMNGFVTDYINQFHTLMGRMPDYEEYKIIMNCYTEDAVPVLSTLAKEYGVFDAWFASVPSQTLCNRSFMHTGTSHGYVLNLPFYHWLWHDTPTIFNRIEEKQDPAVTWKIYYDKLDIVSSTGLQHRALWKYRNTNFFHMDDFESDAANGSLPSYSFLEPRFFIDHSDQHPPLGDLLETSSVLAGELLIHRVYNALRNGKHWDRTLLIITYDEHGGCYDHVPPPAAVPPDPEAPIGEQGFAFDRLGVRVPTVMVSPYIEKGTVISDIHDHTSILKLICDRWDLQSLTERDKHAHTFENVLNRETPRTDMVSITPREYKIPRNALDEPINDLQRAALFIMSGFEDASQFRGDKNFFNKAQDLYQLVMDEKRIAHIKTVGQAIHFAAAFDRRVTKHLSFFEWLQIRIKLLFRSMT